jgi:hypothetical protein
MIAQMETNYATNHPDTGYVCTFATLNRNAEGEPNAFGALSKDESNGYRFSLHRMQRKTCRKVSFNRDTNRCRF